MRVALVADVHANLPALRAVLADAASRGCAEMWCAGDVVGRGPHPNQVIDELRGLQIPTVQGNWDEAVGMHRDQSGAAFASAAAERAGHASLAWTVSRTTEANRAWLRSLPANLRFEQNGSSTLVFHGSPYRSTEYLWSDRPSRVFARIAADEGDRIFACGHTHQQFQRAVGKSTFVAPGASGCGAPDRESAPYAILEFQPGEAEVEFVEVPYDRAAVLAEMAEHGLAADLLDVPPTARAAESTEALSA